MSALISETASGAMPATPDRAIVIARSSSSSAAAYWPCFLQHAAALTVRPPRNVGSDIWRANDRSVLRQRLIMTPNRRKNFAQCIARRPRARVALIAGQRVERPAVVLDRLLVCVHSAGGMAGLKQIFGRFIAPVAQAVVVRQQAIVVIQITGIAPLQIAADPSVQLASPRIQHALVGHFLDQRMSEGMNPLGWIDALKYGHFLLIQPRQLA